VARADGGEMPVRVVLFDLDNTLYDHRHSLHAAVAALRRADRRLRRFAVGELAERDQAVLDRVHHDLVLTGKVSLTEARIERMRSLYGSCGIEIGRAEARRLVQRRRRAYALSERAVPGSLALLRALRKRGLRIGIVSNNLVREQRAKLRRVGLAGLYDSLTISEEAGAIKPDPRIFRIALARTAATPPEAVMVGDSWSADVEGARAAGIRAVWLDRSEGGHTARRGKVAVLRSYRPLGAALRCILTDVSA
jgi:HAD superfamily hydrolase (TIGR01509 family)